MTTAFGRVDARWSCRGGTASSGAWEALLVHEGAG
jgi:hypothetical protein